MKTAMIHLYRAFILLVCCAGLNACTDAAGINFNDIPVVEAYLYANNPVELSISRKSSFNADLNLDSTELDALSIYIKHAGQKYALNPSGDGQYQSGNNGLAIKEGETYELEFEFKGKTISAETVVLGKPQGFSQSVTSMVVPKFTFPPSGSRTIPDPIKFSWSNPDRSYYLLVVENIESNPESINNFSGLGIALPARLFRVEPTQSNSFEVRAQQFQYYGQHRVILYHINPEYALLYQDSGDNSLNIKSPPTNVKNGLGIFTALSSDTLFVNVTQ